MCVTDQEILTYPNLFGLTSVLIAQETSDLRSFFTSGNFFAFSARFAIAPVAMKLAY